MGWVAEHAPQYDPPAEPGEDSGWVEDDDGDGWDTDVYPGTPRTYAPPRGSGEVAGGDCKCTFAERLWCKARDGFDLCLDRLYKTGY